MCKMTTLKVCRTINVNSDEVSSCDGNGTSINKIIAINDKYLLRAAGATTNKGTTIVTPYMNEKRNESSIRMKTSTNNHHTVSETTITEWQLTITTGNSTDAGTNGTIYLKLNGTKGVWNLDITAGDELFQRNQVDVFSWSMPDIGVLKEVELIHVEFDVHLYQSWWLESMMLLDKSAAVEYWFKFNGYIPENQFHYGEVILVPDFELKVNLTEPTTMATMMSTTVTKMVNLSNLNSLSPSSSVHQSEYSTFSNVHGSVSHSLNASIQNVSATDQQSASVSKVNDYQTSSSYPPNHPKHGGNNNINTAFTTGTLSTISNQNSDSTIYDHLASLTSSLPSSVLETSRTFVSTNMQTTSFPDEFLLTSSPYFLPSKINSGSFQLLSTFSNHKSKLNASGTSPTNSSAMLFSNSKTLNIETSKEITTTDFEPNTSQEPSQTETQHFVNLSSFPSFFSTSSFSSPSSHLSSFAPATTYSSPRDALSLLPTEQMMLCVYSSCGQHSALLSSFFNQDGGKRDSIDQSVILPLQERLMNISKELTVDKKGLSKYKRTKSSAVDNRYSATAIGYLGITVIIIPLVLVVASDLMSYQKFFSYRKDKIRPTAPKPPSV
ncbi:hybrid signal transduction histidine kinase L-like [Octopus vulgaris]|uniref:Hybrid signal transduction histidine kinase L-like n=1 Tax=Octopus vulgaris TaxID=6645 RepID=A0AA36FHT2_OCTVU|nr:hybrid signal transduction histidine kinase L-like [Octopus vulgaris]